ncbi:MAG: glycosyltransferase family 4 protein [Ardenticatenaceae bacterium]|nr:glycosyltransferase family 4 protein [Ardenticatenaceae bacterium]
MRILQITNGYPPTARGGVEVYTRRLARGLRAAGHEVFVLCRESDFSRADYDVIDELTAEGVAVRRIVNDFRRAASLRDQYRDATIERLVAEMLAEIAPEVVHIQHAIGLSAAAPALVKAAGRPTVLSMHDYWWLCSRVTLLTNQSERCGGPATGADCYSCILNPRGLIGLARRTPLYRAARQALDPQTKQRLFGLLARVSPSFSAPADLSELDPFAARLAEMVAMLDLPDVLTTPSQFVKSIYVAHGLPAERIRVLPLGVEAAPFAGIARPSPAREGPLRVGYIGTLQHHKGAHVLVETVLAQSDLPVKVVVHGRGVANDPYAERIQARARRDPRIHFAGAFDPAELPTVLSDLDVLVVPSLAHETYSFVVREAFMAGVPVIASSVGAITEVVDDGRNGFLVPPGDPAAVAERLARLARDREQLGAMRQAAAERGRTVTTAGQHLASVLALYAEVIAARSERNERRGRN